MDMRSSLATIVRDKVVLLPGRGACEEVPVLTTDAGMVRYLADDGGRAGHGPERPAGLVKGRRADMDPFLLLGILAVVIGLVGVIVLIKGRKKKVR